MKTRNGFVSNSSSSSFVVKWREAKTKPVKDEPGVVRFYKWKSLLTPAQINKLRKFGFRKCWAHSPSQVPATKEEWERTTKFLKETPDVDYTWGYDVICNQDDVLQFLLENDIPFAAEVHYGHSHVFYDGKKVTVAINHGTMMSMYGVGEEISDVPSIQKYTREQYLKKVSY